MNALANVSQELEQLSQILSTVQQRLSKQVPILVENQIQDTHLTDITIMVSSLSRNIRCLKQTSNFLNNVEQL